MPGFHSVQGCTLRAVFFERCGQVGGQRVGGTALDVVALYHVYELAIFKERH
jgi:hypothetical protein